MRTPLAGLRLLGRGLRRRHSCRKRWSLRERVLESTWRAAALEVAELHALENARLWSTGSWRWKRWSQKPPRVSTCHVYGDAEHCGAKRVVVALARLVKRGARVCSTLKTAISGVFAGDRGGGVRDADAGRGGRMNMNASSGRTSLRGGRGARAGAARIAGIEYDVLCGNSS